MNAAASSIALSKRSSFESLSMKDETSVKRALQSVVDAADEMESFLAKKEPPSAIEEDDSSFASEVRRLQESEVDLRRALDSVELEEDETDSRSSSHQEPCGESFDSPDVQVPLLQPVSPFGSPMSEGKSVDTIVDTSIFSLMMNKKKQDQESMVIIPPPVFYADASSPRPESPRKRQIRRYGLHPHDDEEGGMAKKDSMEASNGTRYHMVAAEALFGRFEYTVRPLFCTKEYKRTVQGTVSVFLASVMITAQLCKGLPHELVMLLLLPALIAWAQAVVPHQVDETVLAVSMLGIHFVWQQVSNLLA